MQFDGIAVLYLLLVVIGTLGQNFNSSKLLNSFNLEKKNEFHDSYLLSHCFKNTSVNCPPWAYCDMSSGICKCFKKFEDALKCDFNKSQGLILSCYCLTNHEYNSELGMCIYNCDYMEKDKLSIEVDYTPLPRNWSNLNHNMCGRYNRTGTLCGKCINNTYLRAYSYDMTCTSCGNTAVNIVKYIVVAYVPLTVFCICVMVLRLNIPSSQIQGYVLFSQIFSSPMFTRSYLIYLGENRDYASYKMLQVFGTAYGIWNLDFFRLLPLNICFEANPLTVLSLDLFVAVYPLLLMTVIYILTLLYDSHFAPIVWMSKPFKAVIRLFLNNWDVKTSIVDAFATFLLLSTVKFLSVCFDLLVPVKVCNVSANSTCKWVVFYDASIQYFSCEHVPYAVIAIIILMVFVITPILILIIYPFTIFQKCLVFIPNRCQLALHVFMDSFHGCLQNGTEVGTSDYRWFSAVSFLVRLVIYGLYGAIMLSPFLPYCVIILVLTAILTIIVDPYKSQFRHYSLHQNVFILFSGCILMCARLHSSSLMRKMSYIIVCIMGLIHLLYVLSLILKWIIIRRKF